MQSQRSTEVADLEKCPATKSGTRLTGMQFNDPLLDLEHENDCEQYKPALACIIAELLGGVITHMDERDQCGFYLLKDGVAAHIKFDEYLKSEVWLSKAQVPVFSSTERIGGMHRTEFTVGEQPVVRAWSYSKKVEIAHTAALLKGLLLYKRTGGK